MTVFIFDHPGVWMTGYSVVKAPNEDEARSTLHSLLYASPKLRRDADEAWTASIVWRSRTDGSTILWDGDY